MLGLTKNIVSDFKHYIINISDSTKEIINTCESISDKNTMILNEILKEPNLEMRDRLYSIRCKSNDVLKYPIKNRAKMDHLFSKYEQLVTCLYELALMDLSDETQKHLSNSCLTSQLQFKGKTLTVRLHIESELKKKALRNGDNSCKDFSTLLSQCYILRNAIVHDYYPTYYCRYLVICSFLGTVNKLVRCRFLKEDLIPNNFDGKLVNFMYDKK